MRHEVPQFIDIEDKIFGPLTFRQAIYLAGSAGAAFVIYYGLGKLPFEIPFILKLTLATPPIALGVALAFVKVNKRPFIYFMESAFYYFLNSKRYIWKKRNKKEKKRKRLKMEESELKAARIDQTYIPKVSRSKLKDLAWSLDMDTNNDNNNF